MFLFLVFINVFCTYNHESRFSRRINNAILPRLSYKCLVFHQKLKKIERMYLQENKHKFEQNFEIHQRIFSEINFLKHQVSECMKFLQKGGLEDVYWIIMEDKLGKSKIFHLQEVRTALNAFYQECRKCFNEMGIGFVERFESF